MIKQPSEDRLKEISCWISQEVFKDALPEAYKDFERLKRKCFPTSLKHIDLEHDPAWFLLAAHFLLVLYEAIKLFKMDLVLIKDNPKPATEKLFGHVCRAIREWHQKNQAIKIDDAQLEVLCNELANSLSSLPWHTIKALLVD